VLLVLVLVAEDDGGYLFGPIFAFVRRQCGAGTRTGEKAGGECCARAFELEWDWGWNADTRHSGRASRPTLTKSAMPLLHGRQQGDARILTIYRVVSAVREDRDAVSREEVNVATIQLLERRQTLCRCQQARRWMVFVRQL